MRWIHTLFLVMILAGGAVWTMAQDAPPQVDVALQDLNTRLGTSLTLEDLDNWTWEEQVYGDTSLGCPQPDQAYSQVTTRGYQIIFEHEGVSYDYRVASDNSFFILCGSTGEQQTTPIVVTPLPTAAPAQETVTCPGGLPVRLASGVTGRVTAGLPSNLRSEPSVDAADVGDVQAGETFTVLDGPVCGNDILWWRVQAAAGEGWIAQGQNGLYFVEPVPQPLGQTDIPLSAENVGQLALLTQIESNFAGEMAWSPDGTTLAVVYSNPVTPGIWLYDLGTLDSAVPTLLETEFFPTALEFSPDGALLVVGYENGSVAFFEGDELVFSAPAHEGAVRDLRFNPSGTVLASIGDNNTIKLWGIPQ